MIQDLTSIGGSIRAIEAPKTTPAFYYMVALLFIIFPLWNGLFFDPSFMSASIYWSIIVIIAFIWLKQNRLKVSGWNFVDYLVLSYFAVYFFSALGPANVEYAVLGLVRGISYILFYLVIRVLVSTDDKKQIIINGLIISGVLFGLYGLSNGFGTLKINGAIFDLQMRRLASNFEYPNTFAIYQGITFLFAVVMSSYVAEQSKRKYLYNIAGFIIIVALILTYSRGTWLVLAGMLLCMLLISPKENKGKILLNILIPIIIVLITLSFLSKATLAQRQLLGWSSLILGIVGVTIFTGLTSLLKKRLTSRQWKFGAFGFGSVLVVIAVALIMKHGLPQNFVQRITSINLQQFSVVQRFLFYRDGLKILSEHPLFGAGPNAWEALWQRYQSYPYTSRQSHSYLIDIIMSVGVVGFLLFIAMIVCTLWVAIRIYRKQHVRNRLITDGLIISLLGLLAHGAIDFDFSYGTINFLMWLLIALLLPKLSIQQENILARHVHVPAFQKGLTVLGVMFSVVISVVACGFLLSDHYMKKANANEKDPEVALNAAENAVALAPYRASAWLTQARFDEMMYKKNNKESLKKDINSSAQNAASIASHDPEILRQAGLLIGSYGDGLQAVDVLKKSWENGRYHIQYPEQYMVYTDVLGTQLYQKDKNKAKNFFQETLNTYHDIEQRIANFKNLPPVLKPEYPYDLTPAMHLYAGESAFYLGQYDEAKRLVEPLLTMQGVSEQDKEKAKVILVAIQTKKGKVVDNSFLEQIKGNKRMKQYFDQLKNIDAEKKNLMISRGGE
ncbi:hypothetical protein DNHGIG_12170 [Collibacillus ludicampi]|uniref:O-antigen ligase-related domain-containing protein n=1 Tax=Collibacillus ludicampi TaxID=2771369 RepID=A0AAV4LD25_9BACL|nr:O-antigen ligase family protein [Collibacillus ludicampi]GIM45668.1 hypothetical protein DNHGIG_12170 [Collibacillus ludicampi]